MMKNDGTDWDSLVEKRLAEVRRDRQAEAQAAQPAPGPEAAVKVIDRIKAAAGSEDGEPSGPIEPSEAPPPPIGRAPRDPGVFPSRRGACEEAAHGHGHRHRQFSWHRARRKLFLLALLALFLAGLGLTFSPQLKQILRFLRPDRDTAEDGILAPAEPGAAGAPRKPASPPPDSPDTANVGTQESQPKTSTLTTDTPAVPAGQAPAGGQPEPDPTIKREPFVKAPPANANPEKPPEEDKPKTSGDKKIEKPEQKPIVPMEPAKPVDPADMKPPLPPTPPAPPRQPELPELPTGPWDTQGQGPSRRLEPQDSVG